MKVLYITCVSKEFGGNVNGGIATHSSQLIQKSDKQNKVGLYSDIKKIAKLGISNANR